MRRRWLRLVLVLLACLVAGSFGLSLALRDGWASRSLLARLSAGFGRPVDVGHFGFSLFSGLRLVAESVTVYDDPRFGQEYFLRAERLTASVRWSALLRGRFEFDTVSLTRPSLNLVRLADGQWNIESWLPPLSLSPADPGTRPTVETSASPELSAGAITARLSRIEVGDGRINFKRDSRKLPLALVSVAGLFDQDAAGHWNIDVQADPMRAPASLQQAGRLRLRGVVGGVSTRLRPANLAFNWEDASIADLSRLLQGRDYGIRGTVNAELSARIEDSPAAAAEGGEWSVEGKLRLQGVHGWALAGRATDPGANLNFQAKWRPADYRLEVTRLLVEAPQSRLTATINLDWSRGFNPEAHVTSSRIAFADLLTWRSALREGVPTGLVVEGALDAQAKLSGWPLRIDDLEFASAGATIRSPALPGSIRAGPIVTEWAGDTLKLRPLPVFLPLTSAAGSSARNNVVLDSPPSSSALLVEGSLGPLPAIGAIPDARYRLAASGSARRSQDLLALVRAWRGSAVSSWTAEGPVTLQLVWTGSLRSGTSAANGTIQARGVQLTTALMNKPLVVSAATIDLRGDQRRINLEAVQALGARWTGTLRGPVENGAWDFDLSADRLDTSDLYAWLGSPARPNLLQRMLPFGSTAATAAAPGRVSALANLQARGHLRVAEILFSPLQVEKLDAATIIDGPSIVLRRGRAELYGGQITGGFEAHLFPEPTYSFDGQFARVDLRDVAAMVLLPGRANGLASGDLKLTARGSDRSALAASLQGNGVLRAREAWLGQMEPASAASGTAVEPGSVIDSRRFALTSRFQVGAGRVRLDQFLLARPGEETEVTGTIDFARRLDLRIQLLPRSVATVTGIAPQRDSWTISGTLDTPRVIAVPAPASRAGVPSARR